MTDGERAVDVRPAAPADAGAVAAAWRDAGRYYAELAADLFQVPAGAVESHFVELLERPCGADSIRLVADRGGEVVGYVYATLHAAAEHPEQLFDRMRARPTVWVDTLMVREAARGSGAGSALIAEVERWARDRGAGLLELDTYAESPLSVPFYERLGFSRHSIVYRKPLS